MFTSKSRLLDCSIRDGGLMNNHKFSFDLVRKTYKAISESNVDYIEIGYKNSRKHFSPLEYGPWKFCSDDDIKRAIDGIDSQTKISVMVDQGMVDMDEFKPVDESPIDLVRIASFAKDIDKAISTTNDFHELGYETAINIMELSTIKEWELDEALYKIENNCNAQIVYIVDTFGSLNQESMLFFIKKFKEVFLTKEIGFHGHNNQQLAFCNTIEAIKHNINYIDGSLYGIGRGAGNCPLELILGFLKKPKFKLDAILDLIYDEFVPLQQELQWGYLLPYAISGITNNHPLTAMRFLRNRNDKKCSEFYNELL